MDEIFNYLVDKLKLNVATACGVLANIQHESSFNPTAIGDNGTSFGLCQWHNSRWDNLRYFCNSNDLDCNTINGQMQFLEHELKSEYKSVLSFLQECSNDSQGAYDSGYYWCKHFEIPADIERKSNERGKLAQNVYYPKYFKQPIQEVIQQAGVHIVQAGETLSQIATAYGTTYQALARLNNISNPNLIYPNQVIKIGQSSYSEYIVNAGDTLGAIAERNNTTWQKLAKLNNISNPNLIYPNQVIRLT